MTTDRISALISVTELAHLIDAAAAPVILDVRWQVGAPSLRADYLAGHIPGARWCDLDADLADPPGPAGRHPLPDPDRLQAAMRRWGIAQDSSVVVYDGANSVAAARAWWVLRWAGLAGVRVLDGGFAAWCAAGCAIEQREVACRAGTVTVRPGSLATLSADDALEWARAGRLIDVRAPQRFRGAEEPIDPVAGHIPGARNVPMTATVGPDGRLLPVDVLRQRFQAIAAPEPVGVYCGSGVTAAHTILALHQAGREAVLYPGSWSEWITDPGRPIAMGD